MRRNLNIIVACLLCLFVAAPAMADYYGGKLNYNQMDAYSAGQGGEFRLEPFANPADPSGFTLSNSAYAESTKDQGSSGSFQSFCLEVTEYISNNSHVKVSERNVGENIVSYAYEGGAGTDGSGFGDPLDSRTAWLYTQFATGQLTNYAYTDPPVGLNRSQTAGALQRLIWSLEGEGGGSIWDVAQTGSGVGWNNDGDKYYGVKINDDQIDLIKLWETAFGNVIGWSGIGNVRVLQLYSSYNSDTGCYDGFRQDQLFLTPVPGAVLLGMLGLGAAGLKLRRFA